MQPAIQWTKPLRPCGPPEDEQARLIGTVEILGVPFHVQAEGVHDDEECCQVSDALETYVDEIQTLVDGAGMTVKINGRDYLLVIYPYQI
jgi:hypothetical protein